MKRTIFSLLIIITISLALLACGKNNSSNGANDLLTNVRIINAISDTPTLDFFLDNKLYQEKVGYLENTDYSEQSNQSQKFQVTISGTGTRLVDTTVSFSDSKDATLLIAGRKSDSSFIRISDDNSSASDKIAKIRFIHASY